MSRAASLTMTPLAAALHLVSIGLSILPLAPGGKPPYTALVRRGVLDATSDPAASRSWFRSVPDANLGIACGASGLVVVDEDPRNGGSETTAALLAKYGPMPPGVIVVNTAGGGRHFYFAASPGRLALPGTLGRGVDVKHGAGYVVAPCSRSLRGTWRWAAGRPPTADELWLLPAITDWITDVGRTVLRSTPVVGGDALGQDYFADSPANRERVMSALREQDPDCSRADYLRVCWALLSLEDSGWPDARDLAEAWARGDYWSVPSLKFSARDFARDFRRDRRHRGSPS